jgi:hypothetical protein
MYAGFGLEDLNKRDCLVVLILDGETILKFVLKRRG